MTNRSNQETEYVVVRDSKPKKPTRYYYDPDDEADPLPLTTRRVVRRKPVKEQSTQYVTKEVLGPEYRRRRVAGSTDRTIQVRNSNTGERFILDENDNIVKIIRSHRSRTPPLPETQQYRIRPREPRTLYYETADGHLVTRSPKHSTVRNAKNDFVYAEEEPMQIVRRVVRNPRTGLFETIYEKQKPKKPMQQKYVIKRRSDEILVNSDTEPQQQLLQLPAPPAQPQPQYVQVMQQQVPAPKQEASSPQKYVIIRKKVDPEPVYTLASSDMPGKTTRRIVYQAAPKKAPMTYVYATNEPYYK